MIFIDAVGCPHLELEDFQLHVCTREMRARMIRRWFEGLRSTSPSADECAIRAAYRRTVLRMADEICQRTAEHLARCSCEELCQLTADDYRSLRRFRNGILVARML